MTWDILNSTLRIALMLIVIYKLTQFREQMILLERVGLGIAGAGSMLTVNIIWEGHRSPFDGWAVTLMTIGVLTFLAGRTWRDRRHQKANDDQVTLYARESAERRAGR